MSTAMTAVFALAAVHYVVRIHREIGARSARVALEAEADRVHEWLARDAALGERVTVGNDGRTLSLELLGPAMVTYTLEGGTLTRHGPVGADTAAVRLVLSTRVRRWDLREGPTAIDTLLALEQTEHSEILRHVSQMAVPLAFQGGQAP